MYNLFNTISEREVVRDLYYLDSIQQTEIIYDKHMKLHGATPIPTVIRNARLYNSLSFENNGFDLLKDKSGYHQFDTETDLRSYLPELSDMLKQRYNFSKVHFHTFCFRSQDSRHHSYGITSKDPRTPVPIVHGDVSPERLEELTTGKKTDYFMFPLDLDYIKVNDPSCKWMILTLWKPLVPIINAPLAVCDTNTINPDSLLNCDVNRDGAIGKRNIYTTEFSDEQQFYIYPLMLPNEILVMKQYASEDNAIIPTLHASCTLCDDISLVGATRRNIEIRCIVELS